MKVILDKNYCGEGPELYLSPESDIDREKLDWLRENCELRGFGRTTENGTWRMLHVRIELKLKVKP